MENLEYYYDYSKIICKILFYFFIIVNFFLITIEIGLENIDLEKEKIGEYLLEY